MAKIGYFVPFSFLYERCTKLGEILWKAPIFGTFRYFFDVFGAFARFAPLRAVFAALIHTTLLHTCAFTARSTPTNARSFMTALFTAAVTRDICYFSPKLVAALSMPSVMIATLSTKWSLTFVPCASCVNGSAGRDERMATATCLNSSRRSLTSFLSLGFTKEVLFSVMIQEYSTLRGDVKLLKGSECKKVFGKNFWIKN